MSEASPVEPALCFCGRPLKHTGHHLGAKIVGRASPKPKPSGPDKITALIEQERRICGDRIATLRSEIAESQATLTQLELRLRSLDDVLALYSDQVAPAPQPPPPPFMPPQPPKPKAFTLLSTSPAAPRTNDPKDYEPVPVGLDEATAWASTNNLPFNSWDDLPRVNERREALGLPTFKRRFGR